MRRLIIAIPTYNREAYLKECIRSIFNQTFQDFEIVIFDNKSDFDIENTLDQFHDSRITLIKNDVNVGQLGNFDKIIHYQFDSPYLMIFHDDDTMHPHLLERVINVMNNKSDLIWVGTGLRFVHDHVRMSQFDEISGKIASGIFDSAGLTRLLLGNFHLAFDTVLYKTNCLIDSKYFTSNYNKWFDRPFLIELSKKGKIAVLNESLVNYRMHPGQVAKTDDCKRFSYIIGLFEFYRDSLPQPMNTTDANLFLKWSTNNLILSIASFSNSFIEYRNLLNQCQKRNLFKWKYINGRGLYYFIKAIINYYEK
ncbi:MAG: glycosyltransferase family 2 protein [Candidatus Magasanikbacteria bacterium]